MTAKRNINLDENTLIRKLDLNGMANHLFDFPALCEKAWLEASKVELPAEYKKINKIVLLGMGGSAIGADMAGSYLAGSVKVPLLVCRDYNLPGYVDKNTLIAASSYSGNTEETLSAFEQSLKLPAKKLAITTGGKLKDICEANKIPVIAFDYNSPPRAALPFSFFLLLGILQKLNLIKNQNKIVKEAITGLNNLDAMVNEEIPTAENPAKSLAGKLAGKLAVIYGAGITTEVAHRWKSQINENSKAISFWEALPELNHNSVVGYEFPVKLKKNMMVIFLDSNLIHPRTRKRIEITQQLLEQSGIEYHTICGEGSNELTQIMNLTLFGDYVSFYLAILNEVDPGPVKVIDFLKGSLAKI